MTDDTNIDKLNDFLDDPDLEVVQSIIDDTDLDLIDEPLTTDVQEQDSNEDNLVDIDQLKQKLFSMKEQIDDMIKLLHHSPSLVKTSHAQSIDMSTTDESRDIIGMFTGNKMRDTSGNEYAIPPNYASKSKLVEGDKLKLSITPTGSFMYKQVEQIERKRIIGELLFDGTNNQWSVVVEGKQYKILKASVTFYKGNIGDEVIILVPTLGPCSWGAVENIIPKM